MNLLNILISIGLLFLVFDKLVILIFSIIFYGKISKIDRKTFLIMCFCSAIFVYFTYYPPPQLKAFFS